MPFTPFLDQKNIYHSELEEDIYLVYAPLGNYAFTTDLNALSLLERYAGDESIELPASLKKILTRLFSRKRLSELIPKNKDPEMFDRLFVFPTNRCNFSCSYCFSAKGRSGASLDFEKLKGALDFFIPEVKTKSKYLSITFAGGGEPLMNPAIFKRGIEYASMRAQKYGYSLNLSLITNGSKISSDIIKTLAEYDIAVTVSYEILREMQDVHRGHFDVVTRAIELLLQAGIFLRIRSTITPANVNRQQEMIIALTERYPAIREVVFETVTDSTIQNIDSFRRFHSDFISSFFNALTIAREKGCELMCTSLMNARKIIERFCPGYLILNPDGNISLCARITSPSENGYNKVCYGAVDDTGLHYDHKQFGILMAENSPHGCESCFARMHCGGGCLGQQYVYNHEQQMALCDFTRDFTRQFVLFEIINKSEN